MINCNLYSWINSFTKEKKMWYIQEIRISPLFKLHCPCFVKYISPIYSTPMFCLASSFFLVDFPSNRLRQSWAIHVNTFVPVMRSFVSVILEILCEPVGRVFDRWNRLWIIKIRLSFTLRSSDRYRYDIYFIINLLGKN